MLAEGEASVGVLIRELGANLRRAAEGGRAKFTKISDQSFMIIPNRFWRTGKAQQSSTSQPDFSPRGQELVLETTTVRPKFCIIYQNINTHFCLTATLRGGGGEEDAKFHERTCVHMYADRDRPEESVIQRQVQAERANQRKQEQEQEQNLLSTILSRPRRAANSAIQPNTSWRVKRPKTT